MHTALVGAAEYEPAAHGEQVMLAVLVQAARRPEPAGHSEHAAQGALVPPADHVVPVTQFAQAELVVAVQSEAVAPWPEMHTVQAVQGA